MANKFNAKKVTADGYTFDSAAEFARYCELKILERAGEIGYITVHPRYDLFVNAHKIGHYTPDFLYYIGEKPITEDVKGVMTQAAALRIKIFEAQYERKVTIIRKRKWQLQDIAESSTKEEQRGGAKSV